MDFEHYWTLIGGDVNFADRKMAAQRAWSLCAPDKQQAIIAWLQTHGRYPGRNPYFFILDFQTKRRETLTFAQYKPTAAVKKTNDNSSAATHTGSSGQAQAVTGDVLVQMLKRAGVG